MITVSKGLSGAQDPPGKKIKVPDAGISCTTGIHIALGVSSSGHHLSQTP